MTADSSQDWAQIGLRIQSARMALNRSVDWLAEQCGLSPSDMLRAEAGQRELDPLDLTRIASALKLGIDWFFTAAPPAVRSLREGRVEGPRIARADLLLEQMARDVEMLRSLGFLRPAAADRVLAMPTSADDLEAAARTVRGWLGVAEGPLLNLARAGESLGLYTVCVCPDDGLPDGAYVALETGGVVVINGTQPAGQRRFTLAHEMGHHVFQDEYATDWVVGDSQGTEKLINAFAIHLLLPRASVTARWNALISSPDARAAVLTLAVEYRVSWTAACAQCRRFGLIDQSQYDKLTVATPRRADYMELGLSVEEELVPPALSPGFARAVLAAFRKNRISGERAIEMLRGTLDEADLPNADEVPLQAYVSELDAP